MLDRYIAKQIIFAQLASDGGKKDKEVLNRISPFVPLSEVHYKKGYHTKDHCIINAIRAIQRNPQSGFRYHVKADRTLYSGAHVFIVYFNFKIGEERYQISFHTFDNMWRFVNRQCVTRWQKKYSSKEAVIKLVYHVYK